MSKNGGFGERTLASLAEEFALVRAASIRAISLVFGGSLVAARNRQPERSERFAGWPSSPPDIKSTTASFLKSATFRRFRAPESKNTFMAGCRSDPRKTR